jgi:hypothetical protein
VTRRQAALVESEGFDVDEDFEGVEGDIPVLPPVSEEVAVPDEPFDADVGLGVSVLLAADRLSLR